jgi:hypothetical protein
MPKKGTGTVSRREKMKSIKPAAQAFICLDALAFLMLGVHFSGRDIRSDFYV